MTPLKSSLCRSACGRRHSAPRPRTGCEGRSALRVPKAYGGDLLPRRLVPVLQYAAERYFRLVEAKLRRSSFEIVFLSTDRPAILYSSLKAQHIHYTLLSDSRLEAAKAFHVAFHLDDATIAKMKDFGVDLDSTTGEPLHELPVPSVFIIDRTGTIRYVYSNPDFKIRLGADALWAAAAPYAAK